MKRKGPPKGQVKDIRGTNPPLRGSLFSRLQAMIYEPPWIPDEPLSERRAPGAPRKPINPDLLWPHLLNHEYERPLSPREKAEMLAYLSAQYQDKFRNYTRSRPGR